MDQKLLGKRIKMARKIRKITCENLADQCHLHPTYMRQIETGVKTPSLPVFVLICQELKVSPSYLLVDALPDSGVYETEELYELWKKATPSELKIITGIVKSALASMDEK